MLIYIIVSILLVALAQAYIWLANRYNIVDKPNFRSSHHEPIIRGAGVLFYFAIVLYYFLGSNDYPYFIIGLSIIAIVSYIDDLRSLSHRIRLTFQTISISVILYQIFLLNQFELLYFPLLVLVGIATINIFNFMDGINGITGMYSLVAFLALYLINLKEALIDNKIFTFIIISIAVFGYYNFRKRAKFFSGDVGSMTLGTTLFFLIAIFSIKFKSPIFLLLIIVYLIDACMTIFYRKYIGENITVAHRHHIYQKLTDKKNYPHLKTSAIYSLTQVAISILIFFGYRLSMSAQAIIFLTTVVILIVVYAVLFKWLK